LSSRKYAKKLLTKALRTLSEEGTVVFGDTKSRFKLASKLKKLKSAATFVGKLKVKQKKKAKLRADRAKMLDRLSKK
jgi:hypothetical protein